MYKEGEIRAIALGIIWQGDKIFVSEGYDPTKESHFYRAMGGGIDFGETGLVALHREFQEEIQAELKNVRYLGCLENIFTFNGKPGHELIQLFECDFVDQKFYESERFEFVDGGRKKTAVWVDINRFKSGELRLVPEQFIDYL